MDGFTIAALVASALASAYSTDQQVRAQNKIRNQQQEQESAAINAERMRQRALNEERTAAVKAATQEFNPESQEADRESITRSLEQYLAPANSRTTAEAEFADRANPGAPKEISESRERSLADAVSKGSKYASDLARLSSLKNLNFGNALAINRLGTNIGELNTQASRSADLLPRELAGLNAVASQAGNAEKTRATAAQGISSLAAMYAASRPGAPAATATPAAQPASAGLRMVDSLGRPLDPSSLGAASEFRLRL